jgi:hypothetical protein
MRTCGEHAGKRRCEKTSTARGRGREAVKKADQRQEVQPLLPEVQVLLLIFMLYCTPAAFASTSGKRNRAGLFQPTSTWRGVLSLPMGRPGHVTISAR